MTETEIELNSQLVHQGFEYKANFYEKIDGAMILKSLFAKPSMGMLSYEQAEKYAQDHGARLPNVKELMLFLDNRKYKFDEKIVWTRELNEDGAHCVFNSRSCLLTPRLASDEVDVIVVKII